MIQEVKKDSNAGNNNNNSGNTTTVTVTKPDESNQSDGIRCKK